MQSKKQSIVEVTIDTTIGWVMSVISYLMILPILGIVCSFGDSMILTAYFVVLSMIRKYAIRRWFNRRDNI